MKRLFISVLFSMFAIIASASVEYGGINYNINTSNCTATAIKSDCSGDISIPEIITIEGQNYEVTEIEKMHFNLVMI